MDTVEIIASVRDKLVEPTAVYWTDARLLEHINAARKDLWRAIQDNFQDYFFAVNESVSQGTNAATLSSVPAGVAKVTMIEPVSRSTYPGLNYFPRSYDHPDMIAARASDAVDPTQAGRVFYAITGAGAPVAAPTIYVAPKFTSAVALRLVYIPVLANLTIGADQENDVPGESDDAIIAFVIAHALAREREDRKPDPDWLAKYATEKTNILTALTPRQNDEPDVAEALFESWTDG
jgi:hypothetical protein